MATTACTIPPLDPSTTSIGWQPGDYVRDPCSGLADCRWTDQSLQFLADAGSPVVAPFPVTVLTASPLVVRPNITVDGAFWDSSTLKPIRITGVTPAVTAGATLERGALLGRVTAGQRGAKFVFWEPNPIFPGVNQERAFIVQLFHALGLDVVGATAITQRGFRTVPQFGGRMLVRAGSPADCAAAGMHGLGRALGSYGFGSAPSGYVEPAGSIYGRYGTSSQSDTTVPVPRHENVAREVATGGGIGLFVLGLLGLAWWARKG